MKGNSISFSLVQGGLNGDNKATNEYVKKYHLLLQIFKRVRRKKRASNFWYSILVCSPGSSFSLSF
jgi:hypothetical protein